MQSRDFWRRLLVLAAVMLVGCSKTEPISTTRQGVRKVILISIDDLRPDYLGCYNPARKTSPALDRFAAESILFTNVTPQASSTATSHKSILYSLYPSIHKTTLKRVPEEKLKSPIEILHSKGFKTAAFVGGAQLRSHVGFSKGFDTYWEQRKLLMADWENEVVKWLNRNYKEDFFLFLHTYEVHCPFYPPPEYIHKYAAWYKGDIDPVSKCGNNYYNLRPMKPEDFRYIQDLYAAEVDYMDDVIGHYFDLLRKLGIYDETLIIFLSDHGESLGERGYVGHNQLYRVQLQIPLILHIPGVKPTRVSAPVESIDVMPTVFDVLGLSKSFPFQGQSLLALIRGLVQVPADRPLISETESKVRVREGNLVCIFTPSDDTQNELYDLSKDPEEANNLAAEEPGLVRDLKRPYFRMLVQNKNVSEQFIVARGHAHEPQMDEQAREQLKALGYVDN